MGRVVKVQASEDIWHLGIEDLLAPPRGSARTAGPGPFVIILRTSTARIGSPPKGLLPIDRLHVYQLMRGHDAQPQFQLRLGIIESEQEADALLSMVREHYPGAIKERAEDDDKAAIARAACPVELAKPARAVAAAKAPVVEVPEKVSPPATRQAAQKPAEHCLLDIDELLAQDDDKAAIARAASATEPVKPASAVADAKTPVVQEQGKAVPPPARRAVPPAARLATQKRAARQAAQKPTEHCRWDIDELLPELAAVGPSGRGPTPPTSTASKSERKPLKLTAPRRSAKAQMPHSAAAPRARPGAQSRSTPPLEETRQSQTSRGVTDAPHVERKEPIWVASNRVLTEPRERVNPAQPPLAKTAQLSVDVSYGVSHCEGAPKSVVVEEIESDPNAITDQVELLTPRIDGQLGAATEAPLPPASASSIESSIEEKPLDVSKPADARPEPGLRSLDASAPTGPGPIITADSPAVDSVPAERRAASTAPAPAAETDANLPVASGEDSGADSGTLEPLVARIGARLDTADAHHKSANAPQSDANASVAPALPGSPQPIAPGPVSPNPPPFIPQSASAQADAPVIDSTQTVRTVTSLELADGEGSCWFAVQLMLREEPIDAEQVPNLGIFSEYRLYAVTGLEQDRVMHALRVGFFSSELAAEAVAGYLVAYFDSPVIKRVSIAERERFADTGLAARKDVGVSGVHAVIELATPAPLAERRAVERRVAERRVDAPPSDTSKRAALGATSLWSRLLAPRNR
ncbi:MAG: hypothetical protein E6K40_07095 [Gammaproteobacteria bacterium]|nr:MAG: hypothetical protein E6K40_07095 [Gammaproteobacteria bacterium]